MLRKGQYYLGSGYEPDWEIMSEYNHFTDYEEALKAARKSHKEEIAYQREECGAIKGEEIPCTWVIYFGEDGHFYEMACFSGWNCHLEEWEYEEE